MSSIQSLSAATPYTSPVTTAQPAAKGAASEAGESARTERQESLSGAPELGEAPKNAPGSTFSALA